MVEDILTITTNSAASNGRFCKMAAVTPQTILCEIERYYPAASLVKPPPRKAAWTLPETRWQQHRNTKTH